MKIMQSEKGRIAQAGHLINKIEKQNLEHTKQDIIKDLDNFIAENIPQELSKEEFLTKGLNEVINKENFVKHLSNSQDSFVRLKYLNLVEPTKQRANIEFTQGERKGYIKAFKDKNKNLFYVLITEDKDKLLITGIPTSKKREVIRQIKKADFIIRRMDSIDTLSPTAKATAKTENVSTSQSNSTIDKALLSKQGIDEVSLVKVQSKFKYDEKKAKDLLEWHKDSSPLTKDKDGLPKVFYHGSKVKGLEEFKSEFDESGLGFWFVDDIEYAKRVDDNLYEVFLNVKNPIDFRGGDNPNYPYKLQEEMDKLGLSLERYTYQTEKTKEFLQSKGYDALILDGSNKEHPFIAIFDSNQIKHINNKGSYTDSSGNITSTKPKDTQAEHRYFNEASPNIYQTNPHIGAGLVSGTLAGVESDENGNIIGFDPAKFALGFLGGSIASKIGLESIKRLSHNPKAREVLERLRLKNDILPLLNKGKKVDSKDVIKILQTSPQKGRDMFVIGQDNLTQDVLEWVIKISFQNNVF